MCICTMLFTLTLKWGLDVFVPTTFVNRSFLMIIAKTKLTLWFIYFSYGYMLEEVSPDNAHIQVLSLLVKRFAWKNILSLFMSSLLQLCVWVVCDYSKWFSYVCGLYVITPSGSVMCVGCMWLLQVARVGFFFFFCRHWFLLYFFGIGTTQLPVLKAGCHGSVQAAQWRTWSLLQTKRSKQCRCCQWGFTKHLPGPGQFWHTHMPVYTHTHTRHWIIFIVVFVL